MNATRWLARVFGALVVAAAATVVPQAPAAWAAPVVTDKLPGQFLAKLYTEGLGRMPDPAGWRAFLGGIQSMRCSRESLAHTARVIYTSAEFGSRYAADEHAARVLTLYRGGPARMLPASTRAVRSCLSDRRSLP